MYKKFFGLHETPFNVNPDPRFLYMAPQMAKALAELSDGIQNRRGCMLLTGEVGTGKTTLINHLLDWLQEQKTPTAFIFNCPISAKDLLEFILSDFRIPYGIRLHGNMLLCLHEWLIERHRAGDRPVLFVDEAQGMPSELLEDIRLLMNIETNSEKLLQIVLIGQPELESALQRPELRQLRQRITLRCKTAPLTREETHRYIRKRLQIAGGTEEPILEYAAMDAAHRFSNGIPRVLNMLCERAMIRASADDVCPVPAWMVVEAAEELLVDEAATARRKGPPDAGARPDLFLPSPQVFAGREVPVCATAASMGVPPEATSNFIAAGATQSVRVEVSAETLSAVVQGFEQSFDVSPFLESATKSDVIQTPTQQAPGPRRATAPWEPQISVRFIRRLARFAAEISSAPRLVPKKRPGRSSTGNRLAQSATRLPRIVVGVPSNNNRGASSGAALMVVWNHSLERWWNEQFSQSLRWRILASTGLAGCILFILGIQARAPQSGVRLSVVICGYLGLLSCAVSLGCGASLLIDAKEIQSRTAAGWTRLFGALLRWLRQPIHH